MRTAELEEPFRPYTVSCEFAPPKFGWMNAKPRTERIFVSIGQKQGDAIDYFKMRNKIENWVLTGWSFEA